MIDYWELEKRHARVWACGGTHGRVLLTVNRDLCLLALRCQFATVRALVTITNTFLNVGGISSSLEMPPSSSEALQLKTSLFMVTRCLSLGSCGF